MLDVGNSLIGTPTAATGQDTPKLLQALASAAGRTVRTTEVIHFGNTLQQTYNAGEVTSALSGATRYDYILLQEYSTLVAPNPAAPRAQRSAMNRAASGSGSRRPADDTCQLGRGGQEIRRQANQ